LVSFRSFRQALEQAVYYYSLALAPSVLSHWMVVAGQLCTGCRLLGLIATVRLLAKPNGTT
jgi:hypothetical protein